MTAGSFRYAVRFPGILLLVAACASPACSRPDARDPVLPVAAAPAYPPSAQGLATVVGAAPPGAVVSLEPSAGLPPPPAESAVMDQRGKQFLPPLLMVQVGQAVEFRNGEDIPHNVFVVQRRVGRTILNVSTDPGQQYTHTFERPGEFDVTCNHHDGMEATLIVTASPLAAVADAQGRFIVRNVPPGTYTLLVSDAGSPTDAEVAVAAPLTEIGVSSR